MDDLKKWEYVIKSLKKLKAPKRAIDLAETIQEQMEVYDLNKNTGTWEYDVKHFIVGDLFDLQDVLHDGGGYCYCCISYLPHCHVCPFNSPSIKECSKELMELIDIVAELNYKMAKLKGYIL